MNRRITAALIALSGAALPLGAAASSPPGPSPMPEDLQFLDNATIDGVVAVSEGGRPACGALTGVLALSLITAFSSMGDGVGESGGEGTAPANAAEDSLGEIDDADDLEDLDLGIEAFYALFAPVLVPLIHRAGPPADPAVASTVTFFGDQLTAAIYELLDLGFTEDDLLELQALMTEQWSSLTVTFEESDATDAPVETSAPSPELVAKVEELLPGHDFESIDLDAAPTDSFAPDAALPWADECPETAAFLDFSVSVEASIAFSITVPG